MIIAIDTNVLLPLFSAKSHHPEIARALLNGQLTWVVSQSIMSEYEEVVTERCGAHRWGQIERFLSLLSAAHDNVVWANPAFQFHVIADDLDDNKFTDSAITVNADYVISHDCHLDALANAGYKPQPITPEEFIRRHLSSP
jgi:putative PIN family toxin of toxin-antitoxin system